jgi:hypothetical protein
VHQARILKASPDAGHPGEPNRSPHQPAPSAIRGAGLQVGLQVVRDGIYELRIEWTGSKSNKSRTRPATSLADTDRADGARRGPAIGIGIDPTGCSGHGGQSPRAVNRGRGGAQAVDKGSLGERNSTFTVVVANVLRSAVTAAVVL